MGGFGVGRVFVDTNVLFPFSLMDLMLALTEDAVHEVLWTDRLLDEWERVIVREHQRTAASARKITQAIRAFFADSQVFEGDYAHLTESAPSADPDDRHHIAAAMAAGVKTVVTWNLQDFPAGPLAESGIEVRDPDAYLCGVLDAAPTELLATVRRFAAEKTRPPLTAVELTERFGKSGAITFAERLQERLR